jgi:hypothetical protein
MGERRGRRRRRGLSSHLLPDVGLKDKVEGSFSLKGSEMLTYFSRRDRKGIT